MAVATAAVEKAETFKAGGERVAAARDIAFGHDYIHAPAYEETLTPTGRNAIRDMAVFKGGVTL